jgi:hypothetical protein
MAARGTPWHLPTIGWLALIWTGLNAADYLLTQAGAGFWLGLFPDDAVAYFATLPAWVDALWAVAVWAGLAGALCLVLRAKAAAALLGLGALAMLLLTLALVYGTRPPMEVVTGPVGVWIMVANTAAFALFWFYARTEHQVGDLP